ncbi:CRTAC1 family protein [Sutcliffiella rhizosphaerae]|uniref:ASPIC/UnbV domain-containing protein n=1 Tax=Sutcliffiella rhizosphaerae TaxID=2880967 RepID=A0ABN8AH11_9BACI|nr:CRTAC1 family protein [Sutcliffiella rhizosphaerae]CAG9623402.1 hypothetical protein BACCIP111883_04213 [Sutcliffiella rhizosphaerae]
MKKFIILLITIYIVGCGNQELQDIDFKFEDITGKSNIDFIHNKPTFDSKADNIMPWLASTGAAVAVGDINNDGYMDLYFTNSEIGSSNAMFLNNGDGTFKEMEIPVITDINDKGISTTALFFDYNNDGHTDLLVGGWGFIKLFENNGDGTFTEVTEIALVDKFAYVSKVIAFDFNKDGYLDLYVGTYFDSKHNLWDLETSRIMNDDFEVARNGGENLFFINNGDGTFTEASREYELNDTGWTLAVGAADVNKDGYPDLYVANDFGPDMLYINEGGEGFEKVIQSEIGKDTHKGMNVDFADIFHEGELGIYVSNVSKASYIIEGNDFWYPNDKGQYKNISDTLGINYAGFSWGSRFFDVNNSGNYSLIVNNGFITGSSKEDYWFDLGTLVTTPGNVVEDFKNWPKIGNKDLSGNESKYLFLNNDNGEKFTNVIEEAGISFTEDGRGVSVIDINNSGELDLVFANQGGPAKVYKNKINNNNNWIKIDLQGSYPSNRDAFGAKVIITVGEKQTLIEKDGGNTHGAQSDPRIHFGTGSEEVIDEIEVIWPSGRNEVFTNVKANQILSIKEKSE